MRKVGPRADLGASIDAFFADQPPHLREILDDLHAMIEKAAPEAASSIKWGAPFYSVNGTMMCALGAHRSHISLIVTGPPEAFPDPDGLLGGAGKGWRLLRLTARSELPKKAVRGWLRIAAELARNRRPVRR